jgi:hypothetical protein
MIKKFFLSSKRVLFTGLLFAALTMGINVYDYDPFHDNPSDTYHVLAAALPQVFPKGPTGKHPLNGSGRPFVQPPKAPNGDACKEVWDKNIPCKVDGKYYGYWGDLQPENCDNNYFLPDGRTLKPDADKCECNIAMTKEMKDCPMTGHHVIDGPTCMKYCQEKDHCHCVDVCDFFVPDASTPVVGEKK